MPRLEFFVVALAASVDQFSNRVSVFEIIESLSPRQFPAYISRLVAVSSWDMNESDRGQDFQVTLLVKRPKVASPERAFNVNFTAEGEGQNSFHKLAGIPLEGEGLLEFELRLDGKHIASHRVVIASAKPNSDIDEGILVYRSPLATTGSKIKKNARTPSKANPVIGEK